MAYQKKTWTNDVSELSAENFNPMEEGIFGAYPVQLIAIDSTAPSTCSTGDKYYNTTSKKIFTATGTNTWGETGETPLEDTAYWLISENGSYAWNGTDLVSIGGGKAEVVISDEEPEEGKIWVDTAEIQTIAGRDRLVNVSNEVDEDYRVNLIHSRNLFDEVFRQGNTGNITTTNRIFSSSNIYLTQGVSYTISTNLDTSTYKYAVNMASEEFPTFSVFYDSGWKTSSSFTFTPSQSGYFGLVVAKSNGTDNLTPSDISSVNWQLEEGSTATTYSSFVQNEINVDNETFSESVKVGTGIDSRSRVNVLYSKNVYNATQSESTTNNITTSGDNEYLYIDGTISGSNKFEIGSAILPAGTYNLNLNLVSGSVNKSFFYIYKAGTWTTIDVGTSGYLNCCTATPQLSGSFTLSETTKIAIGFFANSSDNNYSNCKYQYQIVKGTEIPPTYEPYVVPSIYVDNEMLVSKNTYLTDEVVIGEWLGKPLYRKVIEYTGTMSANLSISHNISNFGEIINYHGYIISVNSCKAFPTIYISDMPTYGASVYQAKSTTLELVLGTWVVSNASKIAIVVEYTKTTD